MSLIIAIYVGERPVDGLETGWDEVERALAKTADTFPVLRSIDPYEFRTLTTDDVLDLMVECDEFLPETDGPANRTLTRLKDLTTAVLRSPGSELRLVGD